MSGRIRTIKPEVLDDEVASSLSDSAWRLWVSLWVLADDYGNARAGDRYLAASVWQDSTRDVEEPRNELARAGLVHLYAVNGQRYLAIVGWTKHQRVDNAGKRRVPGPEENDGTWNPTLTKTETYLRAVAPNLARISASTGGYPPDSRLDHRPPTTDHRPTTTDHTSSPRLAPEMAEEGLNLNPTTKAPKPKASRIPDDWKPGVELLAWCRSQGVSSTDALSEAEAFLDYWRGVPGSRGMKLDWAGTFRNRIRDQIKRGILKPRSQPVTDRPPAPPLDDRPGVPCPPELLPGLLEMCARTKDPLLAEIDALDALGAAK